MTSPGYLSPNYAASLSAFGQPRHLPACDGWLLERQAGEDARDAMGPYPLFACRDWSRLHEDLDALGTELVSVALVADPFGNWREEDLRRCFPDRLIPFKDHHVVCLDQASPARLSKHHRYYARRALARMTVEKVADASGMLDEWLGLYANLSARHGLTGIKAFSRPAFAVQLAVPGTVVLRAVVDGETVGAQIWYVQGEVAYSHLAAVSERGYELMAAYALYWHALEVFRDRVRWLDLGAGAGSGGDAEDGLSRFKRGWATDTRTAWFCGRILDPVRYATLTAAAGQSESRYFPAYRTGEF